MDAALAIEAVEDVFTLGPSIFKAVEDMFAMFGAKATITQKVTMATQILAGGTASVQASLAAQPASATHLDSVLNSIHAAADSVDELAQAKATAMAQAQAASSGA